MTIAFDAATNAGLQTEDFAFDHTPVGTPRGVIIGVAARQTPTDEVDSTTYGGAGTTAVALSPAEYDGIEEGYAHVDFLGSSLPTGVQSVAVNETGGNNKTAWAVTVTADADVVVQDTTVVQIQDTGEITGTLSLGGNSCFCGVVFWTGANSVAGFQPLDGWTDRGEVFFGGSCGALYTYDTIGTADVTFGVDAGGNTIEVNMLGFALTEDAGGPAPADAVGTGLTTGLKLERRRLVA